MLNNVMVICGCLFVLSISLLIIAWAFCIVRDYLDKRAEKYYYKVVDRVKVDIGRHFITDAYWLKGEQMKTLHLLGVKFTQNSGYDISKFREELETYEVK